MADKAEKKAQKEKEKQEKKAQKEKEKQEKKAAKERLKAEKAARKSPRTERASESKPSPKTPQSARVAVQQEPSAREEPPKQAAAPQQQKAAPAQQQQQQQQQQQPQQQKEAPKPQAAETPKQQAVPTQPAETPKAVSADPPTSPVQVVVTGEDGDVAVPMREKPPSDGTSTPRRRSVSMHGAPAQLPAGTSVLEAPKTNGGDDEDDYQNEVVEDEFDEQVGSMTSEEHALNAEYLSQTLQKLRARMEELSADGTNEGYSQIYQSLLPVGLGQPSKASSKEENRLKNRYGNIAAFDHSRVVLDLENEDPNSDYINANWIDGYKKERAFIASQGPVPNSFISHWRMIWQFKIEVIAMVTHEVENGRMKCHRYWPDPTSNPPSTKQQYGYIIVTHMRSEPHKHYVVRTFTIEHLKHPGEKWTVKQFAYTSWPDHGVPLTTHEMLGFRNSVNHAVTKPDVPILVHCSAGVGRTGTFIAIDNLVRQALDRGGELDIDNTIKEMRMKRNFMCQTEIQYIFIHRAVLDALTELLDFEMKKAQLIASGADDEALQQLHREAEEAARRKQEEDDKERAAIEAAEAEIKKQLEKEALARLETSAESAKKVVSHSIADRMRMLQAAQEAWLENYKKTLEEWSARNQFEAETYDLTSSLTPVQSRLEALRQKGFN